MSNTRSFALVYGVVFLAAGIAGFIPGLVQPAGEVPQGSAGMGTPEMEGVGLLFGLFPVNGMHNIVHILFGLAGLVTARSARAAWIYACVVAVAYLILGLMGIASGLQTMFGLVPLWGYDVFLHLALAVGALYFAITGRGKWQEAPTVSNAR